MQEDDTEAVAYCVMHHAPKILSVEAGVAVYLTIFEIRQDHVLNEGRGSLSARGGRIQGKA
jgi:hypothetical protein